MSVRATDNDGGAVGSSTIVNITVKPPPLPPPSPVVSLTAPSPGATFTEPATINITANASISGGSIARLEFLQNNFKIGEDTSSPYTFTWSNASVGEYVLTARATSDQGVPTTSAGINIRVLRNDPAQIVIVSHPQSQTVVQGARVTFMVVAAGENLGYRWRFNGTDISGANQASYAVASAQRANEGTYDVVVFDTRGSQTSSAARLTLLADQIVTPFVERILPGGYVAAAKLTVKLQAKPPASVASYTVSDQPPDGWTVGSVSDGGAFDTLTKRVKFGPFFDPTARLLSYEVTPPPGESGIKQFSGTGSADGLNSAIIGTFEIDIPKSHPADANADFRIVDSEITGYGAAWKRGSAWDQGPSPVPDDYVTRAGFLWRRGEAYRFDSTVASAPLWWVPAPATQGLNPSRSVALQSLAGSSRSTAISELPATYQPGVQFVVTIRVTPASDASAQTISDTPPAGWLISDVSDGGAVDAANGKVKWGPFFDSQARTLTYRVTPPATAAGLATFSGNLSVDGVNITVSGQRETSPGGGTAQPATLSAQMYAGITIVGTVGRAYRIEFANDAGGNNWTALTNLTLPSSPYLFIDLQSAGASKRFYQAVSP